MNASQKLGIVLGIACAILLVTGFVFWAVHVYGDARRGQFLTQTSRDIQSAADRGRGDDGQLNIEAFERGVRTMKSHAGGWQALPAEESGGQPTFAAALIGPSGDAYTAGISYSRDRWARVSWSSGDRVKD